MLDDIKEWAAAQRCINLRNQICSLAVEYLFANIGKQTPYNEFQKAYNQQCTELLDHMQEAVDHKLKELGS